MTQVKTLLVRLLIVHYSYGCCVEYNLIGLSIEDVITCVVTMVAVEKEYKFQ